jgi:hypothetical protein
LRIVFDPVRQPLGALGRITNSLDNSFLAWFCSVFGGPSGGAAAAARHALCAVCHFVCSHRQFVERELRQVVVSARPRHDLHQFNRGCEKVDQLLR